MCDFENEKSEHAADDERDDKRLDLVEHVYYALLDQTFQCFAVLDAAGRIKEANNTFLDIGSYTIEGIRGKKFSDLSVWDDLDGARTSLRTAIQNASAGNFARVELPLRDFSGDLLTLDVSIKPIRSPNFQIEYLIFEARDVTDLKESQDALLQSQKFEMAGHLTSGIAHDFNNILAVIAGHLEIAAKHLEPENDASERIGSALTAVFRGKELTEQLLTLSRKRTISVESLDVNTAIAETAELLDRTLLKECEINIEPTTGLWPGLSDKAQLQTSIVNLVMNACDAMPDGGTATVTARNISLPTQADAAPHKLQPGDYVAVSVEDEGIGMSPEQIIQAVEPFFTTKPPESGTGLGLSIVNDFAQQCGGALTISSTPKIGTTVTLYLPRSNDATAETDGTDDTVRRHDPRTTRVLVVEDNDDLRETVVKALVGAGHHVEQAADAETAMVLLKKKAPFGVLFTDISLSGDLSGRELAAKARALDADIKIILTTGLPDDVAAQSDSTLGKRLLVKPFHQSDLIRVIQQALSEKS